MANAQWYWHRLRAMNGAEIWHRLVEKARHVTEPFARGAIKGARLAQEPASCPALPLREDAPLALKQALASDAAKLMDGKWMLFGWKEVQMSSPPDWHRDYIRDVFVPVHGKLNHRSLPDGADVRTIWEINRWAEPVRLAMHGWLNDDVNAIKHAQSLLADWVEKNPVGQGINWTSALEGGLRLINFCWFDAIVSQMVDGKSQMGQMQCNLRDKIVPVHGWWVRRHLSSGSSANNHLLGELTGLLLAVKRWPELENLAGRADDLWKEIAGCVLDQFAEDGGNREQALHYHLFAYEMGLHACRVMNVSDGPVVERLRRAAEFFVRMSHPQEPWDFGDNDDAQIVPLTMRRDHAEAEWCAWMSGTSGGETIKYWLADPIMGGRCDMIPPEGGTTNGWWIAKESGMAVIERDGWSVRVDASPLGFGKIAAHGHCDALHVSIWDGEHALVIDPGTGGYFGSKELRGELASWDAHNGPQPVEGFETPRRMGVFLWTDHHKLPLGCFGEDDTAVRFNHEKFSVCRDIRFLEDQKLGVWDYEKTKRSMCVRWCLAPECSAHVSETYPATVEIFRGLKHWRLSIISDKPQLTLLKARVARSYGNVQSSTVIQVTGPKDLCAEWQRVGSV